MASRNHLLIDGDILLYQTTQSCLNEADWGDTYVTCWLDMGELRALISTILERWMEELRADDYTICLSDYDRNFRKELEPTYKEQRDGSSKPIGYQRAHEWIQGMHPCEKLAGLEADDVMGIRATDGSIARPIIVSDDKDMRQIPWALYVPRRREKVYTTPEDGYRYHMVQTLTGDRVDNYFGCPGIGEVRAAKALAGKSPGQLWDAVVRCYTNAGQTPADAVHQARLAKILQAEDYNTETGEPILWQPNGSSADPSDTSATPSPATADAEKLVVSRKKTTTSPTSPTGTKPSTTNLSSTPMMTNYRKLR